MNMFSILTTKKQSQCFSEETVFHIPVCNHSTIGFSDSYKMMCPPGMPMTRVLGKVGLVCSQDVESFSFFQHLLK